MISTKSLKQVIKEQKKNYSILLGSFNDTQKIFEKTLREKDHQHRKSLRLLQRQTDSQLRSMRRDRDRLDRAIANKEAANEEAQSILSKLQAIFANHDTAYQLQRLQIAANRDKQISFRNIEQDLRKNQEIQ